MLARFKSTITGYYSHIEETIDFKESRKILEQALAVLSPQQRHVYQLCKLDGCSYKETAAKLGISPHTVKEYLYNAKQLVKAFMEANMETTAWLAIILIVETLTIPPYLV